MQDRSVSREVFLENLAQHPPHRVPGTAVFMFSNVKDTPPALLHNLKHNKVLHERVVFLAVITQEVPTVNPSERVEVESLGHGFWQVKLNYGFMEDVDIPAALATINYDGLTFKPLDTTYFLGRETLIARRNAAGMALWREKLFAVMSQNARSATTYFRLPPNRVVELGAQVEL
jgi:KUP system potassium uptake protein